MPGSSHSRASAFAANLVTLFLVLTAVFGVFVVAKGVAGAVTEDQDVAIHQELILDDVDPLPPGAVEDQTIPVTVRVRDASAEQSLYAMARDLIPAVLVFAVLWFLHAILGSVRDGDPFNRANVRRLRAIGFVLLIGVPVATVLNSGLEGALSSTVGASGSGLALNLPTGGPIAALGIFVLAQVFADGIRLREDVEGTV
ncbi:MAG: DUF2975 domain-containing protein [Actinomycetota bacterium]